MSVSDIVMISCLVAFWLGIEFYEWLLFSRLHGSTRSLPLKRNEESSESKFLREKRQAERTREPKPAKLPTARAINAPRFDVASPETRPASQPPPSIILEPADADEKLYAGVLPSGQGSYSLARIEQIRKELLK